MKRTFLILILFILLIKVSFAQESIVHQNQLVYKVIAGQELAVDMFYSDASQNFGDNSAIALFHGGGWVFGDPSEFYEACRRYARKGYITFSFQYRLSRNSDGTYPHPEISPI
jgi:acetyl esterase/lipase